MRAGNFSRATEPHVPLTCTKCGAMDLMNGAKLTLERNQDGTISCTVCGHTWRPKAV